MELKNGASIIRNEEQIQAMVEQVADQIFKDYGNEEMVIIILLNGGMFFAVDLSRALERRRTSRSLYIDTMSVSSWLDNRPASEVRILKDISYQISGRNVLLVDEVADTRRTLDTVRKHLWVKKPRSLKIAVAVDKTGENLRPKVRLDYVGFPDLEGYLVGYGMDDRGTGRGLVRIERKI